MLTPSILASEQAYGTVTQIRVPPEYVADAEAELTDAGRADLAALVEAGEAGRLIVTAGGIDWPFGGL